MQGSHRNSSLLQGYQFSTLSEEPEKIIPFSTFFYFLLKKGLNVFCFTNLHCFREGKSYRVYVLVPLLPAFEGDVGGAGGGAMHCILHYQNSSIESLFNKLVEAGVPDPTKFISFCSLRTWSELCDTPVTELIYIHSKV